MAYFKCGSGGSSVEIDGGSYDGDLKLESNTVDIRLKDITSSLIDNAGNAVVYQDEIHMIYGTNHRKWNGSNWETVSTFPVSLTRFACVSLNDKIHVIGSETTSYYRVHYVWDGSSWSSKTQIPYDSFSGPYGAGIVNGYLHIFGSNYSTTQTWCYKWTGSGWSKYNDMPYKFSSNQGCVVTLNNEAHLLGGNDTTHYKFDGSTWTSVSTLPYLFYNGAAVVVDNEIHILGGGVVNNSQPTYGLCHYKYNGTSWVKLNNLPFRFWQGRAVSYNNYIYLLGSNYTTYSNNYSSAGKDTAYSVFFYVLNKKIYNVI